jgi:hypothetical protein
VLVEFAGTRRLGGLLSQDAELFCLPCHCQ